MKPLALSLCLAMLSTPALAESSDGGVRVKAKDACNPKATYHFFFDAAELAKVAQTVADVTCKIVVLAPGVEKARITIITPEGKDFSGEQLFAAFVAAAELNGLVVSEQGGIVRVAPKAK